MPRAYCGRAGRAGGQGRQGSKWVRGRARGRRGVGRQCSAAGGLESTASEVARARWRRGEAAAGEAAGPGAARGPNGATLQGGRGCTAKECRGGAQPSFPATNCEQGGRGKMPRRRRPGSEPPPPPPHARPPARPSRPACPPTSSILAVALCTTPGSCLVTPLAISRSSRSWRLDCRRASALDNAPTGSWFLPLYCVGSETCRGRAGKEEKGGEGGVSLCKSAWKSPFEAYMRTHPLLPIGPARLTPRPDRPPACLSATPARPGPPRPARPPACLPPRPAPPRPAPPRPAPPRPAPPCPAPPAPDPTCWLSFRMTIMFLSRKPAWFMASYAMPPVIAPSPMTCARVRIRILSTGHPGAAAAAAAGSRGSERRRQTNFLRAAIPAPCDAPRLPPIPSRPRPAPPRPAPPLPPLPPTHPPTHRDAVVLAALEVAADGHAQRGRDGGGTVPRAKGVVGRLGALGEACRGGRAGAAPGRAAQGCCGKRGCIERPPRLLKERAAPAWAPPSRPATPTFASAHTGPPTHPGLRAHSP